MKSYLLIFAIFLLGCNQKPSASVPKESNTARKKQLCTNQDPLFCLQQACEQSRGRFDYDSRECQCSGSERFVGFSEARCRPVDKKNLGNSESYLLEALDADMIAPTIINRMSSSVPFRLRRSFTSLPIPFLPVGEPSFISLIPVDHQLDNEDSNFRIEDYLRDWEVSFLPASPNTPQPSYYFMESWGDIKKFQYDNALDNRVFQEIGESIATTLLSQHPTIESNHPSGCLFDCTSTVAVQEGRTHYTLERRHLGGVLASTQLRVENFGFIEKVFFLFPSGDLSHILYSNLYEENNGNDVDLFVSHTIKNKDDEIVFGPEKTLLLKGFEFRKRFLPSPDQEAKILLCDTGVDPFDAYNLNLNIRRGSFDGLYGIFDRPTGLLEKYQGAFSLSDMGFPSFHGHAQEVAKNLGGSPFIPLDYKKCLPEFSKWEPLIESDNLVLVNGAFGFAGHEDFCSERPIFEKTEEELLWVFSSGNSGINYDDHPVQTCPQGAGRGMPNVMIVGFKNSGFRNTSDHGKTYVDIFAEADSSSMASSKISHAAYEIMTNYDLNPREAKLALMLSVDLVSSYSTASKSKSGGVLNLRNARIIAQEIQAGQTSVRKGLEKIHCDGWGHCDKTTINKKIGFFNNYKMELI